jgi:RNA-directed DNA polymerase
MLVGGLPLMAEDIRLISSLTCRFGRLTIGAPSSPTVSNKLIFGLDLRLAEIASEYHVNYTRYADDMYFSSSGPEILFDVCKKVEIAIAETASPRLTINKKKTYHASRKKRMAVTGLRITPDARVSVGHELKRRIRVLAHKALNRNIGVEDLGWLHGMLAYVSSIEPEYVAKIRSKYAI